MNLLNIRLSKTQLDRFTSYIGLGIVITEAAIQFEMVPGKEGGFARAVLLGCLAFLTQRPADSTPSTAQVERRNIEG